MPIADACEINVLKLEKSAALTTWSCSACAKIVSVVGLGQLPDRRVGNLLQRGLRGRRGRRCRAGGGQ
jgi:hypothetical protein